MADDQELFAAFREKSQFLDDDIAAGIQGGECVLVVFKYLHESWRVIADTAGHWASDAAVEEVARRIHEALPDGTIFTALSYTEYAALIPGPLEAARPAIVDVVAHAASAPMEWAGVAFAAPVVVAGLAWSRPEDGLGAEELLAIAKDRALSEAHGSDGVSPALVDASPGPSE